MLKRKKRSPEMTGESKVVAGHAVLWNAVTTIGRDFRERFAPGSLTNSLRKADVRALLDHDTGRVVGRVSAGTLRLREDATGLLVEIDADLTTPDGQTLAGTVGRRDVTGFSPSFRVLEEDWTTGGPLPLRTILEAELIEVSVVSFPAYPQTNASLRDAISAHQRLIAKMERDQRLRGLA